MKNEIRISADYGYHGCTNINLTIRENKNGYYEFVNDYGEIMKTVTGLNQDFIHFITKLEMGELA